MSHELDGVDAIACAVYRTKGVEVKDGHFNPLRKAVRKQTAMESLNHETCPQMYYQG